MIVKDCKQELLYELNSQQVGLCVTQDHSMWVKREGSTMFERVMAKDLIGQNATYMKSCINSHPTCIYDHVDEISWGEPLPEWVWQLSQSQAKELLECSYKENESFVTKSKQVVDDLQRLALHAGLSASCSYIETEDSYSIELITDANTPIVSATDAQLVPYTGKVYCFEVPSHVFYCRRNGKPVWIGNCSSHGQKGVFGMILPQHEMPYTKDGIVPDLIINPHAFPSRMTIGHLVETVTAKLCCLEGCYGDGTVFLPFDTEKVYSQLEENGYERHGNEVLYNGRTGQQIETEIFMGPIFYYRLKHMVSDKVHARGDGPRTQLTHQPTSGRSKKGGLRVGEMERDVLLAHGLAQFTKEHMMEKSDKYRWAVCRHCGVIAKYNPKSFMECMSCDGNDISIIETPYAFKLLVQEMEAMGVQMRLGHTTPMIQEEESESDEDEEEDLMLGGEGDGEGDSEENEQSDNEESKGEQSDDGQSDQEGSEGEQSEDKEDSEEQSEDKEDGEEGEQSEGEGELDVDSEFESFDEEKTEGTEGTEGMEGMQIQDSTDMMMPTEEPVAENTKPGTENTIESTSTGGNNVKVIYIGDAKGEPSEKAPAGGGNVIEDEITNVMGDMNGIQDKFSSLMGAMQVPARSGIDIMQSSTQINLDDPMERKFWDLPPMRTDDM